LAQLGCGKDRIWCKKRRTYKKQLGDACAETTQLGIEFGGKGQLVVHFVGQREPDLSCEISNDDDVTTELFEVISSEADRSV
jgi:hypothetical protein